LAAADSATAAILGATLAGHAVAAPHRHFASHQKLACWVSLCPGNNISAKKRKHGRTGDAGTYIKPMLVQAAWAAIRVRGRLQARYNRLVRRFGGDKNPGAMKKAILAIAHTLLKIACQVLRTGTSYQDPGADFYTRRESPEQKQAWLERQLQKLHPGCTITVTISPAAGRIATRRLTSRLLLLPATEPPPIPAPGPPAGQINVITRPSRRSGQGSLPRTHRGPSFVSGRSQAYKPAGCAFPVTVSVSGIDRRGGARWGSSRLRRQTS
jgi:Transposase IS116/IS110/IS902 family